MRRSASRFGFPGASAELGVAAGRGDFRRRAAAAADLAARASKNPRDHSPLSRRDDGQRFVSECHLHTSCGRSSVVSLVLTNSRDDLGGQRFDFIVGGGDNQFVIRRRVQRRHFVLPEAWTAVVDRVVGNSNFPRPGVEVSAGAEAGLAEVGNRNTFRAQPCDQAVECGGYSLGSDTVSFEFCFNPSLTFRSLLSLVLLATGETERWGVVTLAILPSPLAAGVELTPAVRTLNWCFFRILTIFFMAYHGCIIPKRFWFVKQIRHGFDNYIWRVFSRIWESSPFFRYSE
jgi:hypothetical protein